MPHRMLIEFGFPYWVLIIIQNRSYGYFIGFWFPSTIRSQKGQDKRDKKTQNAKKYQLEKGQKGT